MIAPEETVASIVDPFTECYQRGFPVPPEFCYAERAGPRAPILASRMTWTHPDGRTRGYPPPLNRHVINYVLDMEALTPSERGLLLRYWRDRAERGERDA